MKKLVMILGLMLAMFAGQVWGENSDDPLLDARLNFEAIKLRYTEKHPKYIEARMLVENLSRTFVETAPEYRAHINERLAEAEAEEATLKLRYSERHPKRILIAARIAFLKEALNHLE